MLEESISIFKIQGMTACSIRVVICPQCCLYVLSLEHHWTYDLVRSVCRWDNPNKKTLMNIHDFVHGHSPVAPAKSQSEVRNPNNILDASVPDRGPYPVDDLVPPIWEQGHQWSCLSCGGFPSMKLSPDGGKSHNEICMYVFIRP